MTVPPAQHRHLADEPVVLDVRPAGERDVGALADLYASLPPAARVRHLGDSDRSVRRAASRAATAARRGGAALVVEASTSRSAGPGRAVVVGEAHVEPGGSFRRRLHLVVLPDWAVAAGGPLLDAILDRAAADGLAALELDVLPGDAWAASLVARRCHTLEPTDDWLATRVLLGTRGEMPSWDRVPGLRVLVESPGGHWHAAAAARAAGMRVQVCRGPAGPGVRCPAADGVPCPLAAAADVVVVTYPPSTPELDDLLADHRFLHPGVPVVVEGRAAADVPPGAVALDVHDPREVVDRIAAVVAAHRKLS